MGYILETERCRLREMREEDGPILYRLNSDPEVIRYTGDPPFESEAAAMEFIRNYDAYKKYGMGRWLAERKEDGEMLGWCGLKYLPGENQVDLGYRFFRKYWGMGYATETAKKCVTYGFEQLHLKRIIGRSAIANTASVHVLEKCGLKFESFNHHFSEESVQFAMSLEDYHAFQLIR